MAERKVVTTTATSIGSTLWSAGWLFTIGYLHLDFWGGFWGLFIWPVYWGYHFSPL